jgi:hypothetical protein
MRNKGIGPTKKSGANPTTFEITAMYNASVVIGKLERFNIRSK